MAGERHTRPCSWRGAVARWVEQMAIRLMIPSRTQVIVQMGVGWDRCVADREDRYRLSLLGAAMV